MSISLLRSQRTAASRLHGIVAAMSTSGSGPARVHRAFAPLNPTRAGENDNPKLAGIVFDVDGTLCKPQNYMFQEMRTALSIPKSVDILGHISSLPESEQPAAHSAIQAIERKAMVAQEPQPGLESLMAYLDKRAVTKGICTRNFDAPVTHLLGKFVPDTKFAPIITRDFEPPKPHPAGVLECARQWHLDDGADRVIMVGDSADDMVAGRRAGAMTVLLLGGGNESVRLREETDAWIGSLNDLAQRLEDGLESGGPEVEGEV